MKVHCPGFSNEFDPHLIFKRVLIPVEFGPESRRALITACALRQEFLSEIHVFHLSAYGVNDEYIRGLGSPWTEEDVQRQSRHQLKKFGESICLGMPCVYHDTIVEDDPVKAIVQAAEEVQATLVILPVTQPAKGPLRSRWEKIARALKVPVLFMRTEGIPAPQAGEVGSGSTTVS
jgi:nucleotide-binding universal stress UspA family protein